MRSDSIKNQSQEPRNEKKKSERSTGVNEQLKLMQSPVLRLFAYNSHFFGSFCFSRSIRAKRSPIFFTRSTVFSQRNFSRSAFFFFRQFSTSSQVTGVETVGSSLARKE